MQMQKRWFERTIAKVGKSDAPVQSPRKMVYRCDKSPPVAHRKSSVPYMTAGSAAGIPSRTQPDYESAFLKQTGQHNIIQHIAFDGLESLDFEKCFPAHLDEGAHGHGVF